MSLIGMDVWQRRGKDIPRAMASRKGTRTEEFGSRGRVSHDSSAFYNSKLYQEMQAPDATGPDAAEQPVPDDALDTIFLASSEVMSQLPDNSIHLMVTSPPYNVGKTYDEDLTLGEYLEFLERIFSEVYRVLTVGGRACINVANLGRKPYIPVNAEISHMMLSLGFLMRGEIIWDKAASVGSSTAWGSWKSPSNPTLRDVHEYIMIFSKGSFKRPSDGRKPTIKRDEFLEYTKSIWSFPTESATRVNHPAPFPVELPYRLIQLYTYESDIVLDPFMGSGTTAVAAINTDRHFVGYELEETFLAKAHERIHQAYQEKAQLSLFDIEQLEPEPDDIPVE